MARPGAVHGENVIEWRASTRPRQAVQHHRSLAHRYATSTLNTTSTDLMRGLPAAGEERPSAHTRGEHLLSHPARGAQSLLPISRVGNAGMPAGAARGGHRRLRRLSVSGSSTRKGSASATTAWTGGCRIRLPARRSRAADLYITASRDGARPAFRCRHGQTGGRALGPSPGAGWSTHTSFSRPRWDEPPVLD